METTEHFWLHSLSFSSQRFELFNSLQNKNSLFLSVSVNCKVTFLLYATSVSKYNLNKDVISKVIELIEKTGNFGTLPFLR